MSTVQDDSFITIHRWMINDLGLSGNELLIYAILYGFSQGDNSTQIDIQYLVDWTKQNEWLVNQTLISFESRGLLKRVNDSLDFADYELVQQ